MVLVGPHLPFFRKRPTQHAITSTRSSADPRSYQLESHDGSRKHTTWRILNHSLTELQLARYSAKRTSSNACNLMACLKLRVKPLPVLSNAGTPARYSAQLETACQVLRQTSWMQTILGSRPIARSSSKNLARKSLVTMKEILVITVNHR